VADYPQGQEIYVFSRVSRWAVGPSQPPITCVKRVLCSGVKLLEHEADD
jgi:hypothetical protein